MAPFITGPDIGTSNGSFVGCCRAVEALSRENDISGLAVKNVDTFLGWQGKDSPDLGILAVVLVMPVDLEPFIRVSQGIDVR